MVGRTLPVLFDKAGRQPGQIVGRSPYLQPVHVQGAEDLIGTMRAVSIDRDHAYSLSGVLADDANLPSPASATQLRISA